MILITNSLGNRIIPFRYDENHRSWMTLKVSRPTAKTTVAYKL